MHNDPQIRLFSHHPLIHIACAFAGGIVFATYIQISLTYHIFGLVVTTAAAVLATYTMRLRIAGFTLLTALFFAGTCLTSLQLRTPSNQLKNLIEQVVIDPDETVELTGAVTGAVELAHHGVYLLLKVESLKTRTQSISCSGIVALNAWFKNESEKYSYSQLNLESGYRLSVRTKLDRTEQYRNPGVSTLTQYLDTRDIDAIAVLRTPDSIIRVDSPSSFSIGRLLYRWRAFLQQQINQRFSPETAGILDAALLGNRHNLSHTTAERFREGGTFHVLVISGAHISFIGGLILLLVRRLTVRRWLQFGSATLMVWCYAFAVGADSSVVRAALMFNFLALGGLLFRRTTPLNSLGAAALVLLVWSPRDIFDPAFQLTFLSVLAIVVIAWPILRSMSDIGKWRPSRLSPYPPACSTLRSFSEALYWSENDWQQEIHKLSHSYRLFKSPAALWLEKHHLQLGLRYTFAAIMVSVSVQVVLLPLQVVYFHRLSFSSLILTLVVGVLLAALAAVALLALIISQINITVAEPLVKLADTLDWLMIHSVDPFAGFGIASLRVAEYSDWARLVYGLYYFPLVLMAVALSRCKPLAPPTTNTAFKDRLLILLCVQAAMFFLLLAHPKSARGYAGRLELSFLDVGQGDSTLITMPNGTTLLIDGGGRPIFRSASNSSAGTVERELRGIGERVVCEYLWARGLDSIDYVLVTHADADHIDGLSDVIRNFRVRSAIVGRTPPHDAAYEKFRKTLDARQIPIEIVKTGDVLRLGEVEIDVLWPPAANPSAPSQNNDSVVLRVRFGQRTFLLTGDIEKAAEEFLVRPDLIRADVVKVPHHGSKSSSTPGFVSAVGPSLAIISVGQTSMFGHPHREVVERWQAIGAEVLTTGQSGTITVTTDGKDLAVTTFVQNIRQDSRN